MKNYLIISLTVIYFCFPSSTKAQILFSLPKGKNAFTYSNGMFGKDPIFNIGIARSSHIKIFKLVDKNINIFADITNKTNFYNKNECRFEYGGQGNIIAIKNFKVLFRKTFTVTRINRREMNATLIGAEFELLPGIYKDKYFAALDLYYGDSFKGFVAKHGTFSNVFSSLETGWIKPHRSTFKLGMTGGYFIKPNLCLYGYYDFFVIKPKMDYYALAFSNGAIGINYIFGKSKKPVEQPIENE